MCVTSGRQRIDVQGAMPDHKMHGLCTVFPQSKAVIYDTMYNIES